MIKIKIDINLRIILFFILFFISKQIDIYIIFIVSIVLHELAHMIVGMLVGLKQKSFSVNPLGVSIEFYAYQERNGLKKIVTYLAGPIINLIIAIICLILCTNEKIIYTNLILAIFNLIPIMPLDGGRILKEVLVTSFGNKNATIFMNNLTQVILVFITILYSVAILKLRNFAIFLLILYLWQLKYVEDKKVRTMVRAYEVAEAVRTKLS